MRVRNVIGGNEFLQIAVTVRPRGELLPAYAVIHCQVGIDLPAILGIDSGEVSTVVHLLKVSLLECIGAAHEAHHEVRIGIHGSGSACVEAKRAEGLVNVGHVELTQLVVAAECHVVLAHDPVNVVVEGVVVAHPAGIRRGRGPEIAADRYAAEDVVDARLPDVVYTHAAAGSSRISG